MPYYREQLFSVWPSNQIYEVGHPPVKFDPSLLAALQSCEFGAVAPNPRRLRRNQVVKTRLVDSNGVSLSPPKFLSEKARVPESENGNGRRISDVADFLSIATLGSDSKSDIPVTYRNVEIKYSKFGVDDFDFEYITLPLLPLYDCLANKTRYYNKTRFSGLETHINNSYINPLLQLLRFTPLLRNLALHHTATTCLTDTCLLCELGFLFDMLDKAEGQSCQATNFLRTLGSIPEAAKKGLLEEQSHNSRFTIMIQSVTRFLLEQTSVDFRRISYGKDFDSTLAINSISSMRCGYCHNETIDPRSTYVNDLVYLPPTTNNHGRKQIPTFSQVLKASIERETQTRGWCNKCRRYQQLTSRKTVRGVPHILIVNAAIKSTEAIELWSIPEWLPERIGVIVDNGKFFCFEGEDLRLHLQRGMHVITVYDLVGLVAEIGGGEHRKDHLVSLINVAISERAPKEEKNWHLFNDFSVRKTSSMEALLFDPNWKLPAVITYQVSSASHMVDDTWKDALDTSLLYYEWSMNNRPPTDCRILRRDVETPRAGSYVAIDTEFVSLQPEEIEIKADGEREIIRPTHLGLARVSVLRGHGIDEGIPFINDYITINEPIVDYLTKWSGVKEGDLDLRSSSYNLVPLKVAYKKLWLLLNLGCIFIGHGLVKDFRTINIHVPKSQVLDTVDLFYIRARQRKLSLRYLAWYLLKEDIQQETHDSIEDARTAFRLWRKYEEFRDAGIVETMVEEVYREGKKWGYKPPGEATSIVMRSGGKRLEGKSPERGGLTVPGLEGDRETPDSTVWGSGPGTPVGRKGTGRLGAGANGNGSECSKVR